jgi:patatin-like phospholipase/acyl hydrolase
MAKRVILQIDGGGIRGITPAIVLHEIEQRKKISNRLSLVCGTSTGAIIAGLLSAGVSTEYIKNFYLKDGSFLFKSSKNKIFQIFKSKYDRNYFIEAFEKILSNESIKKNENIRLSDLFFDPSNIDKPITDKPIFMATAFNLCSNRTHFIKSNSGTDKNLRLSDVVTWSGLSAAKYFGYVATRDFSWSFTTADSVCSSTNLNQSKNESYAVFQDGGQGTQNCTLGYVLLEIISRNWHNENEVIVISLGTGNLTPRLSFEKAQKSKLGQIVSYFSQAREESLPLQVGAALHISTAIPNIKVFRLNYEMSKQYDLDDIEHTEEYKNGAKSIIDSPVFAALINVL